MLDFEIDDIRRRTAGLPVNVSAGIWFNNGVINFFINNSGIHPIFDVKVSFDRVSGDEISKSWSPAIERPYIEPFRIIHQDEKMSFLGSSFEFFREKGIDELTMSVHFKDHKGISHQKNRKFFIDDYNSSQSQRTSAETSLENIERQLSKIGKALEDMVRISKKL